MNPLHLKTNENATDSKRIGNMFTGLLHDVEFF